MFRDSKGKSPRCNVVPGLDPGTEKGINKKTGEIQIESGVQLTDTNNVGFLVQTIKPSNVRKSV